MERLFIGNFIRVYLKQVVKCVKTRCLGQIVERKRIAERKGTSFLFQPDS